MKSAVVASFGLLFACAVAFLRADDPPPGAAKAAEPRNTIFLKSVDTSVEYRVAMEMSAAAKPGVSLSPVKFVALPTDGGEVRTCEQPRNAADQQAGPSGPGIISGLYATNYSYRAEATFSDGEVIHSGYLMNPVAGKNKPPAAALSIVWGAGAPDSRGLTITASGTYSGSPDPKTAILWVSPESGGAAIESKVTLAAKTRTTGTWSAANVTVPAEKTKAGRSWSVHVVTNGADGKTYCSSRSVIYVKNKP